VFRWGVDDFMGGRTPHNKYRYAHQIMNPGEARTVGDSISRAHVRPTPPLARYAFDAVSDFLSRPKGTTMPHENPIIRAFDELLYGNRTIQERVKAVTDAYAAADLDAWAQFVESLSEKAFDFLESQYGHRGPTYPTFPEGVVPPPLPWIVAADQASPTTQVAELERVEAAYEASIETHGEDVAGNVLEGWRDELGDIRIRLEKARAAASAVATVLLEADEILEKEAAAGIVEDMKAASPLFGSVEPSSLEVEAKLYGDSIAMYGEAAEPEVLAAWQERLARIRAEIDAGAEHPHLEDVADVVEADNAGEQLQEPPTEGEGTEASLPDGTLATEEDGTPLETPEEAEYSDEVAEDSTPAIRRDLEEARDEELAGGQAGEGGEPGA
jgi:hypothetical protein